MIPSNSDVIREKFDDLLRELQARRPNDRSDLDRRWSITFTLTEQAFAYFNTFAITDAVPPDEKG